MKNYWYEWQVFFEILELDVSSTAPLHFAVECQWSPTSLSLLSVFSLQTQEKNLLRDV